MIRMKKVPSFPLITIMPGMIVTYTGYILLFLFIILSLLNKDISFPIMSLRTLESNIKEIVPVIGLFLFFSGLAAVNAQKLIPDKAASEEFGKMLVQDQKGRTKPLFTLSNDILRKVTRENEFEGLTSMQVFLGFISISITGRMFRLISIANKDIREKLGISGNMLHFPIWLTLTAMAHIRSQKR